MCGVLWRVLSRSIEGRVRRLAVPWLVASVFTLTASSAHAQEAPAAPATAGEEAPAAAPSATIPEARPSAAPTASSTPANPPPAPRPSPSNEAPPLAPSPKLADWRYQLTLSGARGFGESNDKAAPLRRWESTQGSVSATLFARKIVDDPGGPRSLLPFLQRTTRVTAFVEAGGGSGPSSASTFGGGGASVLGYVLPALALGANASFSQYGVTQLLDPRRFVDLGALVGFRTDTSLLSLSYDHTVAILGGAVRPVRLGALSLREYVLLARTVGLGAQGTLLDQGASGSVSVSVYPVADLDLGAQFHGGRAAYSLTDAFITTRVGGGGSAGYWFAKVLRVSVGYDATYVRLRADATSLDHVVDAALSLRL